MKSPVPERNVESHSNQYSLFDSLNNMQGNLTSGLSLYWKTAADILEGSGITLREPEPRYYSLEANFFTTIFLYSFYKAGIPSHRRVLYTAVNQCLRGMVTGCDNILDNEYKKTLDTDLPEQGTRFRSVLDIMVSDRVLSELLLNGLSNNEITHEQALAASRVSLTALTKSGVQEASEEGGVDDRISPEAVLSSVHHYKTGMLFQSPWAVPRVIETLEPEVIDRLADALYRIGMGCQIMDDMVDLPRDLREKRHNYVASLIYHGPDRQSQSRLEDWVRSDVAVSNGADLLLEFPDAARQASVTALDYLEQGASALFTGSDRHIVKPTISFLKKRVGADFFLEE
ncbi:MAG: polyprenyl synthetase family protein [Deltaproteobacteria bacterium]|nr:polyprenyl synthetase family protein [Deltaproteobacteria bacterium]